MTTPRTAQPPQRARAALATYLRLLAACLQDEADMIENDTARSDEVLRRFREGVLALSLEDAPLDVLMDRMMPAAAGASAESGSAVVLSGAAQTKRASTAKRRTTSRTPTR
jgi:hypothetical protein